MKVLLVQPPLHPESIILGVLEPLALVVLGTIIKKDPDLARETEVEIIDMRKEKESEFEKKLREFKPNIVGVTGITVDYPGMLQVLSKTKSYSKDVLTVVGGHHATLVPEEFYIESVDLIVRGPGFRVLPQIIKEYAGNKNYDQIPGVIFQRDGRFIENSTWEVDIKKDTFPMPDRSMIKRYKYSLEGVACALLITAQGCPFRCTFCACWKILKGKYLTREPEDVVEELSRFPQKYVFLGDDNTFQDIERTNKICELIKEKGIRKKLYGYARADTVAKYPETFRNWAKIGLKGLTVGFEFIDDKDLVTFNKQCTVETNEKANQILLEAGIEDYAHIMIKPEFEKSDFKKVGDYVTKLGVIHPTYPILTPLPGTELWEKGPKPFPNEHQYFDLAHPLLPTKLPVEEHVYTLVDMFKSNYSPKRWLKAKAKLIINFILQRQIYPWYETRTPEWYIILLSRWWLRQALTRKKMAKFFGKF